MKILLKLKAISFLLKQLNENLIFTSKNAIKSILKSKKIFKLRQKKCFCVGFKTKSFLEKEGFEVIDSKENATDLASLIVAKYKSSSFTFFSGNIRKDSLPNIFKDNHINFNEVAVYQTVLQPKIIKEKTESILFFSPSGVESYLLKNKIEDQACFCIGNTTAKALENKTNKIIIASQPSVENVIKEVLKYYTK
ncbi:MAG: uroporphyrinogen-III synthase [Flavobacterium sp.]|nr:uroporphyrinogen-III synthase [Flavobacterium sp.]